MPSLSHSAVTRGKFERSTCCQSEKSGASSRRWPTYRDILRETIAQWQDDHVPRLGAALAYYWIFSLAPLLMIALAIASLIWGEAAVRGELTVQLRMVMGQHGADTIQEMLKNARLQGQGVWGTVLGVFLVVLGSTGAVMALKDAMNTVWGVRARPDLPWYESFRDYLISLVVVLGVGCLLVVSVVLSTALTAATNFATTALPYTLPLAQAANTLGSLVVVTLLFAMLFKVLPDVLFRWRDVWVGATLTSLLFMLGKSLIGLYLGKVGIGSTFGAAGSVVVLLVWAYYSSQILLLGAEFTQVYACALGAGMRPTSKSVWASEWDRIRCEGKRDEITPEAAAPPTTAQDSG